MVDQQVGRLALRQEGETWMAYYAMPNTMEGALLLGMVSMAIVQKSSLCKELFVKLMSEAVSDLVFEATGHRPEMNNFTGAPESERSGRA